MTNPNLQPSDEGLDHLITEVVIAEDWDTRFTVNAAGMRALKSELDVATDPDEVLALTEAKGEALVRTLGSGALSLFKRDVVAEREGFEQQFGS